MAKSRKTAKENPQLKERKLAGGKIALYLEYYKGRKQEPRLDEDGKPMYYTSGAMAGKPMYIVSHIRQQEQLKLYLVDKPRTQAERDQNRATLELAQSIRLEREQQRLKGAKGYRVEVKVDDVFSYFDQYLEEYDKRDIRVIKMALNRFKSFLRENKKYTYCAARKSAKVIAKMEKDWEEAHKGIHGHHAINENDYYTFTMQPGDVDTLMVTRFKDYLVANSDGEGAATTFARFRKIIAAAVAEGVLNTNPCDGVKRPPVDKNGITKDVLTAEEISALVGCHYDGENPEIRRAFLFSLYTGIRWVDVRELRFSNVDYQASSIKFTQKKTEGHSAHAEVSIPLRADLLQMIGTPEEHGKGKGDRIFTLPSHTMCLKALRHWTARAGISKHITWHSARHSFATNILTNGANIRVVADLLGHASLDFVARYARAVDSAKAAAVNSLPSIGI